MNKLIPLFLGLMLPLAGAFADDSFEREAIAFCRSKGGSYSMGSMVEGASTIATPRTSPLHRLRRSPSPRNRGEEIWSKTCLSRNSPTPFPNMRRTFG